MKRKMTAEEFAAQLSKDPQYQDALKAQERELEKLREDEGLLLSFFASRGMSAPSLIQLHKKYRVHGPELADAYVQALSATGNAKLQDQMIRLLGDLKAAYDVRPVIDLFQRTSSESLRWAIANTFAETDPNGLERWIQDALINKAFGKSREMLALAAARLLPRSVSVPLLLRVISEFPGHVALAMAECGTGAEIDALEKAGKRASGWEKQQIARTIAIIRRRGQEAR